jgi:hypothetical protein
MNFGFLSKALSVGGKAAMTTLRSPIGSKVLGAIPFLGTAATVASLGVSAYDAFRPSQPVGGGALPPMPFAPPGGSGFGGPGMPKMFGGGVGSSAMNRAATLPNTPVHQAHMQSVAMHAGKSHHMGKAQAFAYFQQFAGSEQVLGPAYLQVRYRAPQGFVVIRDPVSGGVIAVDKDMARKSGAWKPHAKPPISVRQWHAIKNAKAAIKHLRKVEKAAHIVTHATTKHHAAPAPFHKKRK